MPQLMAGQNGQAGTRASTLDDLIQPSWSERPAAAPPLEDHEHVVARRVRSFVTEVGSNAGEETRGDGDQPLMAALAIADKDAPLTRLQILEPEAEHFTAPQPTQEHGQHHGLITLSA